MKKGAWKKKIIEMMSQKNLDPNSYIPVIETLADIMEQRDQTLTDFKKSEENSVIEYTNKAGATNLSKNPRIVLWNELNQSALVHWRELGLTPSGFKKIMGDKPDDPQKTGLAAALASIDV